MMLASCSRAVAGVAPRSRWIPGSGCLPCIAMMRQLLDVVNQAVQVPLRVHLRLRSQREAIQALVVPQVGEHRLDDRDAPAVEPSSARAVDGALHAFGAAKRREAVLVEERDLADRAALGMAQAALAQRAGQAVALGALELVVPAAMS